MNRIERGIRTATEAAKFVTHSRFRVGAAIYLGNRLVSIGWNTDRTNPNAQTIFRWEHAELNALIGTSKYDLTRATIYVVRITQTGMIRMAKPCGDCQRVLRAAGLRRVVYTDNSGKPRKMRL